MKIERTKHCERVGLPTVSSVNIATPFVFVKSFSHTHNADDIFIKIRVPDCYLDRNQTAQKTLCVNLRTGDFSAITQYREIKTISASVVITE